MLTLPDVLTDRRSLSAASERIIAMTEQVALFVDEVEKAEQDDPAPRNAHALYFACHAMENLVLALYRERPEFFALGPGPR